MIALDKTGASAPEPLMPDGDILHDKLPKLFLRPYGALCEGKLTSQECGGLLVNSLKVSIQRAGDAPITLARRMAGQISRVVSDGTNVNWGAVSHALQKVVAAQDDCPYRLKGLVLRAAKGYVHDVRNGRAPVSENPEREIIERYMREHYRSKFEERLPLTASHHANADPEYLRERLYEMQSIVAETIYGWASKATSDGSVKKLQGPRRPRAEKIDYMADNLL